MIARDLNPLILGLIAAGGLTAFAFTLRKALSFEDTTVEARDLAPEAIVPAELQALIVHGDRANALLAELRQIAVEHFEADPDRDQITPAQVFHLQHEDISKAQFAEFAKAFEGVLQFTRKYKLALDQKTQRSIQKIYFAWDPGGNAIQVKTGDRLWRTEVKPGIERLLGSMGEAERSAGGD